MIGCGLSGRLVLYVWYVWILVSSMLSGVCVCFGIDLEWGWSGKVVLCGWCGWVVVGCCGLVVYVGCIVWCVLCL